MAEPIHGNTSSYNQTPGSATYSFFHTQNVGADGMAILQIANANGYNPISVTYGGQAMTALYVVTDNGIGQMRAFFYLTNPPTGNNQVVITYNTFLWNPGSYHMRSFTGCGGTGNFNTLGVNNSTGEITLNISQDSSIMMIGQSSGSITNVQIPLGTNASYVSHNTNRTTVTGAISNQGLNLPAGSTTSKVFVGFGAYGDAIEILGAAAPTPTRRRIIIC